MLRHIFFSLMVICVESTMECVYSPSSFVTDAKSHTNLFSMKYQSRVTNTES